MNKNASFVQKRLSRKKFPAQISIWLPIFMPCSLARSGWIVISLNIDFYIGLWDSVLFHIFLFFHSLYFALSLFLCLSVYLFPVYLSAFSNLSVYLSLFSVWMFLSLSLSVSTSFLFLFLSIFNTLSHPFTLKYQGKKCFYSVFLFADSYTLTSFHFCILFYSF